MVNNSRKLGLSFSQWMAENKYNALLAILSPVVASIIQSLFVLFTGIGWTTNVWIIIINISHFLFLSISLYHLGSRSYLKDVSEREKGANIESFIKDYLKSKTILENGPSFIFGVIRFTVKHFYFVWITVWLIWIVQYVAEIIYPLLFDYEIANTLERVCMHFHFFFRNLLYISSTIAIFYIYFLLSNIPVNVSEKEHEFKWTRNFIIFFLSVLSIFIICDFFGVFIEDKLKYTCFILTLTTLIGLFTCISIISVASRLNSPHLNVPVGIIVALNIYAAIQVLYPVTIGFEILNLSGDNCGFTNIFNELAQFLGVDNYMYKPLKDRPKYIEYYYLGVSSIYNILTLIGQICLFFTIRWILDQRRLIFYILCRSKTISEHNDLLEHFNQKFEE